MVHGQSSLGEGDTGIRTVPPIALIGCGYWGKNLCRNLQKFGALAAVFDATKNGQSIALSIAPETRMSASFDEVLKDDRIQGIALATPAETHAELAIQAMQAGKDVFVEKPMALTLDDAEKMKRIAEETNRILMVGHLLEYHPAVLKLREMIATGELGKINYIYSNRLNFGKIRTAENALWSFAPHDVAVILRLLAQSPIEVSATAGSYLNESISDTTISSIRFADETRAHIFVSWLHPFKEQRLVVIGDKKMAIFNDVAPYGEKLMLYDQSVLMDGCTPVLKKEDAKLIKHPNIEPLHNECQHFLECINSREQPLTNAQSGIEVLKILHACQSSMSQNGSPVEL